MAREYVVGKHLLDEVLADKPWLRRAYSIISSDPEVRALWEMSNVMAVKRLLYNDHGPVHARIAAGASLALYELLVEHGVESTLLRDGVVDKREYAWLVPLYGALLHDIGNAIHRDLHEKLGALLARPILDRILPEIIEDRELAVMLRQEIMHSIFCTAYDARCLTVEAGCVSVGDGLDMAEGRARVPYHMGSINIHSVSALSIKRVEITRGDDTPIKINIYMDEMAGVFQVDEVLMPKLKTTPLKDYVEITAISGDREIKTYSPRT